MVSFDDPELGVALDGLDLPQFDELDFGLVVLDDDLRSIWYNTAEEEATGFKSENVIGKLFFDAVGPCMNNYLVAEQFRTNDTLDHQLDYIFTVNLDPTPVRLRMMKNIGSGRQYLAVDFR